MDIFSQYPTLSNAVVDSTTEIYDELLTKLKLLHNQLIESKEDESSRSCMILQLKEEIESIRSKLLDLDHTVTDIEERTRILHQIASTSKSSTSSISKSITTDNKST